MIGLPAGIRHIIESYAFPWHPDNIEKERRFHMGRQRQDNYLRDILTDHNVLIITCPECKDPITVLVYLTHTNNTNLEWMSVRTKALGEDYPILKCYECTDI